MVMNQLADFSVIFEQPCETLKQCLTVRKQTTQLISIDENLFTLDDMLFIIDRRVGEIVNIKISRVGGLTKRGVCVMWHSTRYKIYYHGYRRRRYRRHRNTTLCLDDSPAFRIATWLCQDMLAVDVVDSGKGARNQNGRAQIPENCAGLASTQEKMLGKPVAVYL